MLSVSIQTVSMHLCGFIFILLNNTGFASQLNSLDGINLFYTLTTKTFNLEIIYLTIVIFFFLKKKYWLNIFFINLIIYKIYNNVPEFFYIINYTKTNTGLINPLGQYHPPLLFFYLILYLGLRSKKNYLYFKNSQIQTHPASTFLFISSFLLSMWWAVQELFWGGYWNWDPVEFSLLLIGLAHLFEIHCVQKKKNFFEIQTPGSVSTWTLVLAFVVNRGPLANSVHSFSNSFFLTIDKFWYYLIISILSIWLFHFITKRIQIKWFYQKKTNIFVLILVISFLISILYLYSYELYFKNLNKNQISTATVFTIIYTYYKPTRTVWPKIPIKRVHIPAPAIVLLLTWLSEAPTQDLYLNKFYINLADINITDQYFLTSTNQERSSLYWTKYWKIGVKHYSHNCFNYPISLWSFSKYNSSVSFFILDHFDLKKIIWLVYWSKKI
jgi:hypothetical protein